MSQLASKHYAIELATKDVETKTELKKSNYFTWNDWNKWPETQLQMNSNLYVAWLAKLLTF